MSIKVRYNVYQLIKVLYNVYQLTGNLSISFNTRVFNGSCSDGLYSQFSTQLDPVNKFCYKSWILPNINWNETKPNLRKIAKFQLTTASSYFIVALHLTILIVISHLLFCFCYLCKIILVHLFMVNWLRVIHNLSEHCFGI